MNISMQTCSLKKSASSAYSHGLGTAWNELVADQDRLNIPLGRAAFDTDFFLTPGPGLSFLEHLI